MKIGIIKERKSKIDNRVALNPEQCKEAKNTFKNLDIVVESSDIRSFTDDEYRAQGISVVEDVSDCDVLLGVKEVPIDFLIPNKTYFFFSHTIKKQAYNKNLLRSIISKNIRMIDYEAVVYENGSRVLGFGNWAGIVGAHNGLQAYGKKTKTFEIPSAYSVHDYDILKEIYQKLELPKMKIAITGSGRVSVGALEVMELMNVREVSKRDFIKNNFDEAVYVHLVSEDLYSKKSDGRFDKPEFYKFPERYRCNFNLYAPHTDVLLNGILWNTRIERLFEVEDIKKDFWNIQTIADITCDIDGSIPLTYHSTTIQNPTFGVSRETLQEVTPFIYGTETVDVMAVDNLPNELPRDASSYFGEKMIDVVLPELLKNDSPIILSGTLCENGKLTKRFSYLQDFVNDENEIN